MSRSPSLYLRSLPDGSGPAASAAEQRARLLDAMARVVVRRGLDRTTVADVVEVARISRRTFYEQFADKEACFLAAYETAADVVLAEIAAAARDLSHADWRERLRCALEACTRVLAGEPEVARLFLVDVVGAGPRAVDLRRRVLGRFAGQLRALCDAAAAEDPAVGDVTDTHLRALVGGMNELVQEHVHAHGAASLTSLAPVLEELAHAILERPGRTAPAGVS